MVYVEAGGARLEGSKVISEVAEGSQESCAGVLAPEVSEEGCDMVGHRFHRMRRDKNVNIRRSSHVRVRLSQDVQLDAGRNSIVVRRL